MDLRNIIKRLLLAAVLVGSCVALTGCKTTVKNYQDAYDVAREKRERDEARHRELQAEMGVDREKLQSVDDEPTINRIQLTDTLSGESITLKAINAPFHRDDNVRGMAIAIARFKMPTNANALAADLQAEGFEEARAARSGSEYYVLLKEGTYPSDLASEIMRFRRKLPDFPYVGFGEPVLVYPK